MSPVRIIVIAILIYIAYRLITGGRTPSVTPGRKKTSGGEMPVSDTLEEDPVCKKLVPRQQAVHYEHQGKKHYFCSKECCNTFRSRQGEYK